MMSLTGRVVSRRVFVIALDEQQQALSLTAVSMPRLDSWPMTVTVTGGPHSF
jgi:hypothetical protein